MKKADLALAISVKRAENLTNKHKQLIGESIYSFTFQNLGPV